MAILARDQLIDRLRSSDPAKVLVVSPILTDTQISAASIDLRMGNVALMVRARGSSHVEPKVTLQGANATLLQQAEIDSRQRHERYEIPFKSKFLLHPGSLALVPTLEWVALPNDLHGAVTAKSTWAREGLSIATATFVEPGYRGIITLELANLGEIPITLYPGLRLAQIAFATVLGNPKRNDKPQFQLSFEPKQGELAKIEDKPFLPT